MPIKDVLVVPGGWHSPVSYQKLRTALEQSGFNVHIPAHISMNGTRPPNGDLTRDTENTRALAEKLVGQGLEVVAVLHSYGGQVGTNAFHGLGSQARKPDGLRGGVTNLIYMTASALPEGMSMMDLVDQMGHTDLVPLAFDFADDKTVISRDPKTLLVGESDVATAEVDEYVATLSRWNGHGMYQPITAPRSAWRDIPVTYVHCMKDMTLPYDYQKWMVESMIKEGVSVQTTALETGHAPHLTATKDMIDVITKVARGEKLSSGTVEESKINSKDDVKDVILNVGRST